MISGDEFTEDEASCIKHNRHVAYQGNIGRLRRDFCIEYIKAKKIALEDIKQEVNNRTEHSGMVFTCKKGCANCCVLYIEANISECEAIVYYLYENDRALSVFLNNYTGWRRETGRYGDILVNCITAWKRLREDKGPVNSTVYQLEVGEALLDYCSLNVPCPFLNDNICTIYEVRPYVCASHYVTTPAEWCSPLHQYEQGIYRIKHGMDMADLSFYYEQLKQPVITAMPLAVYEILKNGYIYLSTVTGLEGLKQYIDEADKKLYMHPELSVSNNK